MEILPANSEVALQLRTSQISTTTAAAAWHVLGLLLSHGRPARLSELVSSIEFFYPTPDFIRFLCSIPDSPLRFTQNHFVTLSQIGLAAVAQFFANSDVTRYLDFPKVMPRFLANDRSNGIVRTYCRKRKRGTSEIEDLTLKKKSYFQDFDEEKTNEMLMRMHDGFWGVYNQGIETLSPLLAYDCQRLEKIMFKPATITKHSSGQLGFETENVGHGYTKMGVIVLNKEELGYLHRKRSKSDSLFRGRFPHIDKQMVAEHPLHSVPHPALSLYPCVMGNSEGSRISDIDIVNINDINVCTSSKLEVYEQIAVSQVENDVVDQVYESLTEDVNWKRKEVSIHEFGRSRGHKENQQMHTTYTDRYHIDNPEKTLDKANNVALLHVGPRTDDHLQSQGHMPNHLLKYSSMPKPSQPYSLIGLPFCATDSSKAGHNLNFDQAPTALTKYLPSAKSRKLSNTRFPEAVNKTAGKVSKSLLPPGNLKNKVDKAKVLTDTSSRNIIKSQGADVSGVTSAKDATSTRTPSAERLREPLPSQGRKELISLVQEALQGGNHVSVKAPMSKRKRVAAHPGDTDSKFLYPTPMPLHANGIAIGGAGLVKNKGDGKHRREGPCVGTKGFKAPEVLFRSLHQGPKADIWSAGVTLLYLMIGRAPFIGDTDQNIKEIATLRGSEDLWEVAKLHNHESLFPTELLDVKYLSPVKLQDWCARNTRRPDFVKNIPASLFDLVDKCLTVNPRQRISAEEALRHQFFAPCHEALRKHRPERGVNRESGSIQ